jgi:hypothetical protein
MQTNPFVGARLLMRWMIVPMGIVKKLKRMSTKNSSDSTNTTLLLFLSTDAFKLMVAMDRDEMVFKRANQTTQSAVRRW